MVAECPSYEKGINWYIFMTGSEQIGCCNREVVETWGGQTKAVAIRGDKNWPEKARSGVKTRSEKRNCTTFGRVGRNEWPSVN